MSPERQVYLLDPQTLPPETIAVTFAKTSRSPQSFREIAAELTEEKSAEFHDRWVVGYGHSSVAEHAILHIAVENISRLAVECLESNRLASYTEKSTRYQKWDAEAFYTPLELADDHPLKSQYTQTCRGLFAAYQEALPAVRGVVYAENPPKPGESDSAWDRRMRSEYVDVCRFLLPAASLANVGMTINARALEHAIRKMLSHPLAEVRAMGAEIKQVALAEVPTLVKYAEAVPYLEETARVLAAEASQVIDAHPSEWCHLISCDEEGEIRVLAAALYRYGSFSYPAALEYTHSLSTEKRALLAKTLLTGRERYDIPLRELEHAVYSFDLVLDQGAYFELKRHRMMTQTTPAFTPALGYSIPRRISAAGMEDIYRQAMDSARETYELLAQWNPTAASYVLPNAYNRRVLITSNLRSLAHLINLRTAPTAHFSLRRIVHRIAEKVVEVTPLLGAYLRPNVSETWQSIEANYFTQVQ